MTTLSEELNQRLVKLQDKIKENQMDAYVISDAEDIWYYTNIEYSPEQRPFFFVVFPNSEPLFIVPKLEESHVEVPYFDYKIETYFDVTAKPGDNWYDILKNHVGSLSKVGIEENTPVFVTKKVDAKWDITNLVQKLREIKSPYEIEKIEEVSKITSQVVEKTLSLVKTGTPVIDTVQVPYKYFSKELSKFTHMDNRTVNAVWPAEYSYMPHSIPAVTSKIGAGSNVDIAIFKLDGYAAECERTFFTEEPTEDEKRYFNLMMGAREIMLSMLKPGIKASSLEEATLKYFEENGVEDLVLHRPGHGIGLNNHEEPTLSRGNDTLLQENMVISVEPALYVKGLGGFRHSDTVLITKDGYRSLTYGPTSLEELTLHNK